jgi:hypothetical protein
MEASLQTKKNCFQSHQAGSQQHFVGQRTIARVFLVRQSEGDWSSEYKLHSRSQWEEQELFRPALREAIQLCPGNLLP